MNTMRFAKNISGLGLGGIIILAGFLLAACTDPLAGSKPANGKVTLAISTNPASASQGRTVVADIPAGVDRYRFTLTPATAAWSVQTLTIPATQSTASFASVEPGSWDVLAEALATDDTVIANGSLAGQTVSEASDNSWSVVLQPVARDGSGTGSLSLALRIPSGSGVDSLTWSLEDGSGAVASTAATLTFGTDGSDLVATISQSGLASGTYALILAFAQGTTPAGTFREAVTIWNGLTSNRWVNPVDGSLLTERSFAASEFSSHNALLSGLSLHDDKGHDLLGTGFSSSLTSLDLGLVSRGKAISFTPVQSIDGQGIQWSFNNSNFVSLVTGCTSRSLGLAAGTNTLIIRVTAPDGTSTHDYTFTFSWAPFSTGGGTVAMEMVQVKGGTFTMGTDDAAADAIRHPAHTVTVSDFMIGKYEVTQSQYLAVMGNNPSSFIGSDPSILPVGNIKRDQAYLFCNRLSVLEGLQKAYPDNPTVDSMPDLSRNGYRLPTDAEWEFAARGGIASQGYLYPGSNNASTAAVFNNEFTSVQPVGSKVPNELGIYDMAGNVYELCEDWINTYTDGSASMRDSYTAYPEVRQFDPLMTVRRWYTDNSKTLLWTRNTGVYNRSLRGGAFNNISANEMRCDYRETCSTTYTNAWIGFRVVKGARPFVRMVDIPGGYEPGTTVTVKPFSMSATKITQAQFRTLMGFTYSPSTEAGEDMPECAPSFYDALAFCNKLSLREGLDPVYAITVTTYDSIATKSIDSATVSADFSKNGYRLPTLSERLYAARGGATTTWYWGNTLTDYKDHEWALENTFSTNHTMPVGLKKPNGFGLFDMTGNTWEWSWGTDAQGLANPTRCGWNTRTGYATLTTYSHHSLAGLSGGSGYSDNGFRVVRGQNPGKHLNLAYAVDNSAELLVVHTIDANTGICTEQYDLSTAISTGMSFLALSPDKSRLFLNDGDNYIWTYSINQETGIPTLLNQTPTIKGAPGFMTSNADGNRLYVKEATNFLTTYQVATNGSLTLIDTETSSAGINAAPVIFQGKFLYLVADTYVHSYAIAGDGTLSALPGSPLTLTKKSVNYDPNSTTTLGCNGLAIPSGSTSLYLVYSGGVPGTQKAKIDSGTGALDFSGSTILECAGNAWMSNLIIDPQGTFLYYSRANPYEGLWGNALSQTDGTLSWTGGSQTNHVQANTALTNIAFDPSGRFVLGAIINTGVGSYTNTGISAYAKNMATGVLSYDGTSGSRVFTDLKTVGFDSN